MRKLLILMLAVLMCISLPLARAAGSDVPEIKITWLSADREPSLYISELDWLVFGDDYDVPDDADIEECYILKRGSRERVTEFDYIYPFSDGLACVVKKDAYGNKKYGYIDQTGVIIIPLEYDEADNFSDGLAFVGKEKENEEWEGYFVDTNGEVAFSFSADLDYHSPYDFSEGLLPAFTGDEFDNQHLWGFLDKKGEVAIPFEYADAFNFSDGLACVAKKSSTGTYKYGYIDKTGAVVVPLEYDSVSDFHDGLARVGKSIDENDPLNRKYGYIDNAGALVAPIEYDWASDYSEGFARVGKVVARDGNKETVKSGFLDKDGNVAIPLEYDDLAYVSHGIPNGFSEGLAKVRKDERCGFIDYTGDVVIPLEYDRVENFYRGIARVWKEDVNGDYKQGFINKDGTVVIPLEYDDVGIILEVNDGDDIKATRNSGRLCWVKRGLSYGIFENPYFVDESKETSKSLPIAPIAIGVGAVVIITAVIFTKKYRQKES